MDRQPRVLVVGDAMTDTYYFGTATRVSPEAPVLIVKVNEVRSFPGGAENVIANLRALGADTKLVFGEYRNTGGLPNKNRLMVGNIQVARWDQWDELQPIAVEKLEQAVSRWTPDAIVVSDYGKGSVSDEVISWVNSQQIPLFVDTKGSPARFYYEATFFPNAQEYDTHEKSYNDIEEVILKQGAGGISRLWRGTLQEWFPAYARNVVSVCGAGDTVIAAYAYFTILGDPAALFKASIAAAVVVEKPWTATATLDEIDQSIKVKNWRDFCIGVQLEKKL